MKLPMVRRWRRVSRGQALVEMALILPVLVMLLLLSIDFGRVFFGWVAINNASRIAANEAAFHPEAWEGSGNALLKDIYRNQVALDLQSINCEPAGGGVWQTTDVPDPTYIDEVGTPTTNAYEIGDHVRVEITCHFSFLTPLVGLFVGDPMPIAAASEFAVKGGEINGIPVGNGPPAGCLDKIVPNLVGLSVSGARNAWTTAGFTGAFSPASGQDTETVATQNTTPASSVGGCLVATATVVVTTNGPPPCSNPDATVPNLIGLTVSAARSTWSAAGFNNNTFSPASGSDNDTVVPPQITSPSSNPGDCRPKNTTVTVTHTPPAPTPVPNCVAPDTTAVKVNVGQSRWDTAGFVPANFIVTRPPPGNYTIGAQTLVAGQSYQCDSTMTVQE